MSHSAESHENGQEAQEAQQVQEGEEKSRHNVEDSDHHVSDHVSVSDTANHDEQRRTLSRQELAESDSPSLFVLKDRFGFFLTDEFHQELSLPAEELRRRREKEEQRGLKWVRMLRKWSSHFPQDASSLSAYTHTQTRTQTERDRAKKPLVSSRKLKERVRKGIPDAVRGFVWHSFACYAQPLPVNQRTLVLQSEELVSPTQTDTDTHTDTHTLAADPHKPSLTRSSLYKHTNIPDPSLLDPSRLDSTTREEIERDVDRTFPRHVMFVENGGPGQASLRRLLQWYACVDEEVGYCQGMGFIAGLFLTYMSEEEAWETFYAVLQRPSAPLRLLYLPRLTETQKLLFVFEKLCEEYIPAISAHFEAEGMHPTMFFTEWIMCIFSRGFSFELVTRVWDVFLHEGDMKIVYRVALAILKSFEKKLLSLRFEKIMNFMRQIANSVDAHQVMEIAWQIPVRRAVIHKFEKMHEENVRLKEEEKKKRNAAK